VPWTVVELAEDSSFDAMFLKIQAGAFDIIPVSDNLRKSILVQALAGSTKESLNVVSTKTNSWHCIVMAFKHIVWRHKR
jgi:hypothetical protein